MNYHRQFRDAVEAIADESDWPMQIGYNCQGIFLTTSTQQSAEPLYSCSNMLITVGYPLEKVFAAISTNAAFMKKCSDALQNRLIVDKRLKNRDYVNVSRTYGKIISSIGIPLEQSKQIGINHCQLDIYQHANGNMFPRIMQKMFGSLPQGYISIPGGQISSESQFWSLLVQSAETENGYLFAPGWYHKNAESAKGGWAGGKNTIGLLYRPK